MVRARRKEEWDELAQRNGGVHPHVKPIRNRLLERMRTLASSALRGGGMSG